MVFEYVFERGIGIPRPPFFGQFIREGVELGGALEHGAGQEPPLTTLFAESCRTGDRSPPGPRSAEPIASPAARWLSTRPTSARTALSGDSAPGNPVSASCVSRKERADARPPERRRTILLHEAPEADRQTLVAVRPGRQLACRRHHGSPAAAR